MKSNENEGGRGETEEVEGEKFSSQSHLRKFLFTYFVLLAPIPDND